MVFQLVYPDVIPSAQKRGTLRIKHQMRRAFGVYLRKVWRHEKLLADFLVNGLPTVPYPQKRSAPDDDKQPFYRSQLAGYSWIPLVSSRNRLKVDLNIEILSPSPGFLKANGDLDNRLKVVLDSLRMVRQNTEIDSADAGRGEDLFVLLEDDSLIHSMEVTAVQSLGSPEEHRVTVDVKVVPSEWDRHPALPFL
jgi:hypothetical protein